MRNSVLTDERFPIGFWGVSMVQALIKAGANIEVQDEYGGTPLHVAAGFSETPAVVQALLDAGADPKARDEDGRTPFDLISEDSPLKDTEAYRVLREARPR